MKRKLENMNFDPQSYEFDSLDMKIAVSRLPKQDQDIMKLYFMGHSQREIGIAYNASRSMISKRMRIAIEFITRQLSEDRRRLRLI